MAEKFAEAMESWRQEHGPAPVRRIGNFSADTKRKLGPNIKVFSRTLTGETIVDMENLRRSGKSNFLHLVQPDTIYRDVRSMDGEVGIDRTNPFVPGSEHMSYRTQIDYLRSLQRNLTLQGIRNVRVEMGSIADYFLIMYGHMRRTGDSMLGTVDALTTIRTNTGLFKGTGAVLGNMGGEDRYTVNSHPLTSIGPVLMPLYIVGRDVSVSGPDLPHPVFPRPERGPDGNVIALVPGVKFTDRTPNEPTKSHWDDGKKKTLPKVAKVKKERKWYDKPSSRKKSASGTISVVK